MSTVYGQFFVGDRQEIVAYPCSCRVVHDSRDSRVLILDRFQKTTIELHVNLCSVSNVAQKACIISGLVLQFFNAVTKSRAEGPRPYFTKVNNCRRNFTRLLGDLLSEIHVIEIHFARTKYLRGTLRFEWAFVNRNPGRLCVTFLCAIFQDFRSGNIEESRGLFSKMKILYLTT